MSVITETPPVAWPLPTKFTPRDYQLDGLQRGIDGNIVYDIALGGGKSTLSTAVIEALGCMRVLVLCPAKVIAVWRDEVAENAARQWTVWSGQVNGAHGKPLKNPSVARRAESIIQANTGAIRIGRPFMAVVNYEATNHKPMRNLLLGTDWDALICDESHKLAKATGTTSKLAAQIAARVRGRGGRVLLCTGTFMPHSPLSVFGQLRVLDSSVLGEYVTPFRARYASYRVLREQNTCPKCFRVFNRAVGTPCPVLCRDEQTGRIAQLQRGEPLYLAQTAKPDGSKIAVDYKIPGARDDRIPEGVDPDREAELMDRIAPYVHRVSQEELDAQTGLVETPPQLRTCTLRPATRKVYEALERDMIVQLAEGTITAANAMVNVLRLAQATSGYGVDADDGRVIPLSGTTLSEKATLLADELADLPEREPVVIFARFHHDLDNIARVCRMQGRRYAEISGRRSDGLAGHRMSDDCDVVGVQPQAGGAGISLTRAALCIFYTSDWSLANYDQAKRRVLRQGQTRHVTYLHLVAEDTVDVSLFYALKKRRETNEAVLARLTKGPR